MEWINAKRYDLPPFWGRLICLGGLIGLLRGGSLRGLVAVRRTGVYIVVGELERGCFIVREPERVDGGGR
jgi:hypothetical protein